MRAVFAALILLLALAPSASGTHTVWTRCTALTGVLNLYRSPDLRVRSLLCDVAHSRSYLQWKAGRIFHDLTRVMRALNAAGVCWRNVGEAVAWNNYGASARIFIRMWRGSPIHWDMLTARRYDRGGGSWYSRDGLHYATYYVLDLC
jgi:uncharacterized protein YkwD